MPGVSREQVERARQVDLLSWLQDTEPHNLRRVSSHEYCLVDHDSCKLSNNKWFWHSRGFGGYSALDFLIKARGEGFVTAVEILAGSRSVPVRDPPASAAKSAPKKPFILPESARFPSKAIAYLQDRGISPDVIGRCLQLGILYESKQHHNCVFVGRDETGKARFAAQRGIDTDFKRDVAGSEKRIGFCYPAQSPQCKRLAVFESAIDSLSHATMQECEHWKWDGHRLALGGTSPLAMIHFLNQRPEINRIHLCLDNDDAGRQAADRMQQLLASDYPHIKVSSHTPAIGKDWNDTVKAMRLHQQDQQINHNRGRSDAALSI